MLDALVTVILGFLLQHLQEGGQSVAVAHSSLSLIGWSPSEGNSTGDMRLGESCNSWA